MDIKEIYSLFKKNPIICTDSRKVTQGAIFFALKGDNFNGNKYAENAINDGCAFAIIDEKEYNTSKNTVLVDDVLTTLQQLAAYHRDKLNIPIIGITGTNGKTTSKELINSVLNSELNCYATKGNFNNHIGVPLSILEINDAHEIAIIEMGANHLNEIDFLCNIAKPTHGVITNIGSAHLEGFRDLQGVINTKSELYKFIKKHKGLLFVNADDKLLIKLSKEIDKETYGANGDYIGNIKDNTPFIKVKFNGNIISSNLIGDYQFYNIMLAASIGKHFKITENSIKKSLEGYIPSNNRSEVISTSKNTIILDAYNANPSSMNAMITSFSKQDYKNKICILGDMLELGSYSKKEHSSIINLVSELNLNAFFIGEEFLEVNNNSFKDREDFETFLKSNPIKNKTILLKGSRGIGLEKLVELL